MREILEGDEVNHQLLKRADYAGNTALHLAAVGPEPLVLHDLLTRGASVHARNRAGNSPLYLAEKMGNAECVRLLKDAGAHLWLDNELKGEGSRVPSRRASRPVSPDRAAANGRGKSPGKDGRDAAGRGSVDVNTGEGIGGGGGGGGGGGKNHGNGDDDGEAAKGGDEGRIGAVGAEAEPIRALLTGDKGKIVG